MNSDQSLARTGRWARHILKEDDLRTPERVDALAFIVTVMSGMRAAFDPTTEYNLATAQWLLAERPIEAGASNDRPLPPQQSCRLVRLPAQIQL